MGEALDLRLQVQRQRKPTKRTHEMICLQMMGWATTDEVEAHLAELQRADDEAAKKR
jgi:hypothetical protein